MGTPEDFAVNGRSVGLRLGDRESTVQLNANGTGKSAQTWRRIPHPDASDVARGGRLDCDLVFRGADGLDRSPPPGPDALPDPTPPSGSPSKSPRCATPPPSSPSPAWSAAALRGSGRHYLRFTARIAPYSGAPGHCRTAPPLPVSAHEHPV